MYRLIYWRGWNLRHLSIFLAICIASIITACEDSPRKPVQQAATVRFIAASTLEGQVTDRNGLLKTGKVLLSDAQNQVLAIADIQEGRFQVTVSENTALPLVLSVESADLRAVVIDPWQKRYDINTLTTVIAEKAKALGGYSRSNMVRAAETTVDMPAANRTSTGFRGDLTTQYGGWN